MKPIHVGFRPIVLKNSLRVRGDGEFLEMDLLEWRRKRDRHAVEGSSTPGNSPQSAGGEFFNTIRQKRTSVRAVWTDRNPCIKAIP